MGTTTRTTGKNVRFYSPLLGAGAMFLSVSFAASLEDPVKNTRGTTFHNARKPTAQHVGNVPKWSQLSTSSKVDILVGSVMHVRLWWDVTNTFHLEKNT